jgi:hypothetical protein
VKLRVLTLVLLQVAAFLNRPLWAVLHRLVWNVAEMLAATQLVLSRASSVRHRHVGRLGHLKPTPAV